MALLLSPMWDSREAALVFVSVCPFNWVQLGGSLVARCRRLRLCFFRTSSIPSLANDTPTADILSNLQPFEHCEHKAHSNPATPSVKAPQAPPSKSKKMADTTFSSAPSVSLDPSLLLLADLSPTACVLGCLDDFDISPFFDLGAEFDLDPALWASKAEPPSECNTTPPTTASFAVLEPFIEALQDDAPVFGDLFSDLVDFELGTETIAADKSLLPSASFALTFSATKGVHVGESASPIVGDSRPKRSPSVTFAVAPAKTSEIESSGKRGTFAADSIVSTYKTSSQRQKEEIASLRDTAVHLEEQLAQLKARCCEASPESSTTVSSAPTLSPLWEGFAKRQREARKQAEQENDQLRQELRTTIRVTKSLERSLHKRQRL
ncbi:hypothetical protein PybrP1_004923 [[Pythium] brassicae (nom. inval.)]|nr:hypothetical protein PybrP1_004923 [[Pythium] brassicae (nom. inval.)]